MSDPYRTHNEVLPPGARRSDSEANPGIYVGAGMLCGERTEEEAWEHWSWVSGISKDRYEKMVEAEDEVVRLKKEIEALMSPGIIEGMRRACLLRKDASAEEVLAHLRGVASSYEELNSRFNYMLRECDAVEYEYTDETIPEAWPEAEVARRIRAAGRPYHMTKEQESAMDKALLSSVEKVSSFEGE